MFINNVLRRRVKRNLPAPNSPSKSKSPSLIARTLVRWPTENANPDGATIHSRPFAAAGDSRPPKTFLAAIPLTNKRWTKGWIVLPRERTSIRSFLMQVTPATEGNPNRNRDRDRNRFGFHIYHTDKSPNSDEFSLRVKLRKTNRRQVSLISNPLRALRGELWLSDDDFDFDSDFD